jgi:tight adherence protein C
MLQLMFLGIIFAIFLGLFLVVVPFVRDYLERLDIFNKDISDLDRKRKKTLIGILKPLLESVVETNKSYEFSAKWMKTAQEKWGVQLLRAGSPGNINGEEFLALKQVTPVLIFLVLLTFLQFSQPILLIALTVFSMLLPGMWLKDRLKAQSTTLARALPDAIDTFALVVGSGLDFSESMAVFIRGSKEGALKEEFSKVTNELRLGISLQVALGNMADRTDSSSITDFTTAVIQSQKTGTSLGGILDDQAKELRQKRFDIAEQMGQRAPVKMMGPLLLLIFPNIFIVLLVPMILSFLGKG